jgi:hypothetical protein
LRPRQSPGQTGAMLRRPSATAGPGLDQDPKAPGLEPVAHTLPAPRYGLANPVVAILLLAGFFDGISGTPVGGVLLASVGVALARSRVEELPAAVGEVGEAARPRSLPVPAWLVAVAVVGYAILAAAPPRFSWLATLAVVLPGTAVVVAARRPSSPRRPIPAARPSGAVLWAVVLIAIAIWELINLLLQPSFTTGSWDHPTLSMLADPAFATHAGRAAGLAAWLGAGWYVMER